MEKLRSQRQKSVGNWKLLKSCSCCGMTGVRSLYSTSSKKSVWVLQPPRASARECTVDLCISPLLPCLSAAVQIYSVISRDLSEWNLSWWEERHHVSGGEKKEPRYSWRECLRERLDIRLQDSQQTNDTTINSVYICRSSATNYGGEGHNSILIALDPSYCERNTISLCLI